MKVDFGSSAIEDEIIPTGEFFVSTDRRTKE
jgi:hypothetical protein